MECILIESNSDHTKIVRKALKSLQNSFNLIKVSSNPEFENLSFKKKSFIIISVLTDYIDITRSVKYIKNANKKNIIILFLDKQIDMAAISDMKKAGVDHVLDYPLEYKELVSVLSDGKETSEENLYGENVHFGIVGNSPAIQSVNNFIMRSAESDLPVLIEGESGTGKELVASAIHNSGERKGKPLIAINCGAMPKDLLENELFGHEAGAFTGATAKKRGLFEVADGGTLFIDEIGEMDIASQVKLLRVLENNKFRRLGSTSEKAADVRIIAATNKVLEDQIDKKLFRADLYYRLGVLRTFLPPLRSRKDDIPVLVKYFLKNKIKKNSSQSGIKVSDNYMDSLMKYDWPGNIRELLNIVSRSVVLSVSNTLTSKDLPENILNTNDNIITNFEDIEEISINDFIDIAEERYLVSLLRKYGGDKQKLLKISGISRAQLYRKLSKHNIK